MLAHGIGGIQNLPIPRWVFFVGAAGILTVSFLGLFFLWPKPVLAEKARGGRTFPGGSKRFLLSPGLRVVVGRALVRAARLPLARRARRKGRQRRQLHADLRLRLLLGRDADRVGGVRQRLALSRPVALGRGGRGLGGEPARPARRPPFEYPARLGRWPAAVLLLLVHGDGAVVHRPVEPAGARAGDRRSTARSPGSGRCSSARRRGSRTATASRSISSSSRGSARSAGGRTAISTARPVLRPLDQGHDGGDDPVRRGDARLDVLRRLQPHEHLAVQVLVQLVQRPGRPDRPAAPRRHRRAADEHRRDARLRAVRRRLVPARDCRDGGDRRAKGPGAGVRRQPDPDRARLRDRALLLAARLPGRGRATSWSRTRGAAAGICSARTTSRRTSRS